MNIRGNFVSFTVPSHGISLFKLFVTRSWFSLALYALSKMGFQCIDSCWRSSNDDAQMDMMVCWRTPELRDTYSAYVDTDEAGA